MKCKVFNDDKQLIEEEINGWLENNNIEIVYVTQTQYSTYVTICIFYYSDNELRKNKLYKLNKKEN